MRSPIIKATIIPFPAIPVRMLIKTIKKTRPNLSWGTNGHGPNLSSLLIPKLADNIDERKVAKKKGSEVSTTPTPLLFGIFTSITGKDWIRITRSTCDWGIDSKKGSGKEKYSIRNTSASIWKHSVLKEHMNNL